ncbi:hypothetical protein K1T71_003667 [Dendrolimus kikuchii]|uniref:Uncharacterized protein n=1 Tax=Dendrolimus kikuchii TaxID=765133 RepID=A0ACC1D8K1_9NEOP|nr:hypothetical protein K1T71_003667 [Dendrolimus kikuchii]
MQSSLEQFHSLPNLRRSTSDIDIRRLYSLSLSKIKQYTDVADYHHKPSPFNIHWINGYNHKVGVINLNNNGSTNVFYAASNCGVLYNWSTHEMKILQGHRHMLTSIAADATGKWLVTADSGPENTLIIWDSNDYFPQKTVFSPHGAVRIAKVAISADAKYLLTLGYPEKAKIYWWIWSLGLDEAHATLEIDIARDAIIDMGFNPYNSEQFLLLTKQDIWIGTSGKIFIFERGIIKETNNYQLNIRKPDKKIHPDYGSLTCYTFVKATSQILVATSRGAVLVYGYTMEHQANLETNNVNNLKFIKVLKVEKHKINVIKSIDGVIVTGNSVGEIHFYEDQMKLLYWVHGFTVDSVKGLSFNISPRSYKILDPKCNKMCLCWEEVQVGIDSETGLLRQKLIKKKLPSDATAAGKPFVVRDFIICSHNQGIGFVDFVTEKLVTILDYKISPAVTLTVHPEKPFICIGYVDGIVELHHYIQHKLFKRLDLRDRYKIVTPPKDDSIKGDYEVTVPQLSVTCVKYSPSGLHLACGLNTGELLFFDPITIDILTPKPFKDTSHAIKLISYSCDSLTMAMADGGRTVCVYKYDCKKFIWNFIGKHRAHYKDISSLLFIPQKNTNGEYKLISLGVDRIMVEYDIGESSEEYLEIYSLDRMEQTAVPLAAIVWPTPSYVNSEEYRTDLPMILVANDEHKYKVVNYATTMTLSTVLGPRYEHPVRKLQLITNKTTGEEMQYLLFATKNIIGLQKMPLDGNPWKHVGLLGHPVQVIEMCFREDTGTLFTVGTKDSSMIQWAANYRSVESTTKLGGGDLDPYYCLVENGRPGWLFQEIRDLFYYIQILWQGTFTPAMRRVKDYIPIDSLPDLMRALYIYTSNPDRQPYYYYRSVESTTKLGGGDLDPYYCLVENGRPGWLFQEIRDLFYYIQILCEYFSRELSWYLLTILCGHGSEDKAAVQENDFSFLPEEITFEDLANNIIGIENMDNISEQTSAMESLGSQQTSSSYESEAKCN